MAIHFDSARWKNIEETYTAWWEHRLNRPVLPVRLVGVDPEREEPRIKDEISYMNPDVQGVVWNLEYSPEDIIDRMDYDLSRCMYLGDAFPRADMFTFGPGILAAFLGAEPKVSDGHVWFQPKEIKELKDIHFEYDPDNRWLKRIKDVYRAGLERWGDSVIMGMVDLSGILDVLAMFRDTNNLLVDLYEEPEEVVRLVKELDDLWMKIYDELNRLFEDHSRGYSDWSGIYSNKRSYTLQSDFTFMISNEMFREFALDSLVKATKQIPNTLYHLDGPGELTHLDDFVNISTLNAIQWIPGAGSKPEPEWPEVYKKIYDSGKGIQTFEGFDAIDAIGKTVGGKNGFLNFDIWGSIDQKEMFERKLKEFGVE